jgi:hypothetical protein
MKPAEREEMRKTELSGQSQRHALNAPAPTRASISASRFRPSPGLNESELFLGQLLALLGQ